MEVKSLVWLRRWQIAHNTQWNYVFDAGEVEKWTHCMHVGWKCNLSEVSLQQLNRNYFQFTGIYGWVCAASCKCFGFICTFHLLYSTNEYHTVGGGGDIKCNRISLSNCWRWHECLFGFQVYIRHKIARISTFQCFPKAKKRNIARSGNKKCQTKWSVTIK